MSKIETELKFKVKDVIGLFQKIGGPKPNVFYIKDEIYGSDKDWKVRKRTIFSWYGVKEQYEKTTPIKSKIKKVLEEKIDKIPDGFGLENSYDKIRYFFKRDNYEIAIDFYTIGVFCEIEGPEKTIKRVADKLGMSENIKENIDTLYCKTTKEPLNHWGFLNH